MTDQKCLADDGGALILGKPSWPKQVKNPDSPNPVESCLGRLEIRVRTTSYQEADGHVQSFVESNEVTQERREGYLYARSA